jgi:hypothetical protein
MSLNEVLERGQRVRLLSGEKGIIIGKNENFEFPLFSNVLAMEIGWTDVGSGGYILVSCAHSNTS